MTKNLDLDDIQGNIIRAYGKFGYPKARHFFLHVKTETDKHELNNELNKKARHFIRELRRYITTAHRWKPALGSGEAGSKNEEPDGNIERPEVTINVAFSWRGLQAMGLPTRTLSGMPPEFIDGMANRAYILGDVGKSDTSQWDDIWRNSITEKDKDVHILISMNVGIDRTTSTIYESKLNEQTKWLRELCLKSDGAVSILDGVGPDGLDYQEACANLATPESSSKEHFGYADGFGNPVFEGQYPVEIEKERVIGRGKYIPNDEGVLTWEPIATGEFLLGHPDEAQELPEAPMPSSFLRNGSFMAYRKLHQNTYTFDKYVSEKAKTYKEVYEIESEDIAKQTLSAKMVGRWRNGVPLIVAPTWEDLQEFVKKWAGKEQTPEYKQRLIDFTYAEDHYGEKCPVSAHIRRGNPRDMLDPAAYLGAKESENGSSLNKRRRILRRGLPYGVFEKEGSKKDDRDHGIIFIAICASLFRQFEFVQQQWMQYGMDFRSGNDTCPVIGNHDVQVSKHVIPAGKDSEKGPFIADGLPQFVETHGGEYFFIPSMTALRMIAMGSVDPTT
tara:strand:+ start:69474 stop:71150 length:1677 start_codon:yes stop_codon:yes gene_type:complete